MATISKRLWRNQTWWYVSFIWQFSRFKCKSLFSAAHSNVEANWFTRQLVSYLILECDEIYSAGLLYFSYYRKSMYELIYIVCCAQKRKYQWIPSIDCIVYIESNAIWNVNWLIISTIHWNISVCISTGNIFSMKYLIMFDRPQNINFETTFTSKD